VATSRRRWAGFLALLVGGGLALVVLASQRPSGPPSIGSPGSTAGPASSPTFTPSETLTETPIEPPGETPSGTLLTMTLVGAGDIADCDSDGDEATAALLEDIPGTVFTLGDNAYDDGTAAEFAECYDPSWGRPWIRGRTRPVPGNHDYRTPNASAYFDYFGAAAGDPARGYYAYDLGAWRVYVLNSNCEEVGGCEAGSPQERWLRADLTAKARACTIGMWHHARFSSGEHGNDPRTSALFEALYETGAELVLVGHDHTYERFAPQTPAGRLDEATGIVQIIAGTGGRSHYDFPTDEPNSVVRNGDTFGVLRLLLSPGAYGFDFLPVAGRSFSDRGSGSCH
jgi:hypothetical protein